MKSIYHYIFSFLILLTSCESKASSKQGTKNNLEVVADLIENLSLKFKSEKDLVIVAHDSRITREPHIINLDNGAQITSNPPIISLGFCYYHDIENIEMGRELLIYCIQETLAALQREKKLCLDLPDPVTEERVEITIYPMEQQSYFGEGGVLKARNGHITYFHGGNVPIITESYQNGLQEPSILKAGYDAAKKIRSEIDLHPHYIETTEKSLYFDYFHEVDLKSARKILLTCAQEFLNAFNSNEPASPLKLEDLYISVHVRHLDEDKPRSRLLEMTPGKIWHFFLKDGILHYNDQHKDTEREKSIFEQSSSYQETYEKAVHIAKKTQCRKFLY